MQVVVTDPGLSKQDDPFGDITEEVGASLHYADCETEKDVIEACRDATVIITFIAPISRTVLERLENLTHIIRMGTGFDNVDVKAATDHGIPVSNLPGYATQEVSEHAITLMLGAARTVAYSDRQLRTEDGWGDTSPITPMYGKTFGIVGLGRIGRAVVSKARGLGMEVIATDPYLPRDVFSLLDVEPVAFNELLERADCVSIHAPLTNETRHLLSRPEFERMKESSIVVNTARGPIIDEQALVEAVEDGEITAAGIDVYEQEPPDDSPVLECDQIVCSPHQAARCEAALERYTAVCRAELSRILHNEHPQNIVNPEVLQYGGSVETRS